MTTMLKGTCPECEFAFEAPPLGEGETLACPECQLNLQVRGVERDALQLTPIETSLDDWGQ
jgi:alpha-aminoadipate/glutamate carrier protein LysW